MNSTNALKHLIEKNPYQSYTYAYPHKTAYRPFADPISLHHLWEGENWNNLFLYLHIPFCSMRCGFCNLFTLSRPQENLQQKYVQQMLNYINVYADVFQGKAHFASAALGGGTPSYLKVSEIEALLTACENKLKVQFASIPSGVEVSPETVTAEKMQLFAAAGIKRVSMGVQSFFGTETDALVRKQVLDDIHTAINTIRQYSFPTLNLDLIYGIAGQTTERFLQSLKAAVAFSPEELYLYPLYVRPLTGLGRIRPESARIPILQQQQQDLRPEMYQVARDFLLAEGYVQHSMRMFKKQNAADFFSDYSCQRDGMVGIGCGARSYTRQIHYSEEYGVARSTVHEILHQYSDRDQNTLSEARYGFTLTLDEQKRRFVLQSLLNTTGLNVLTYSAQFDSRVLDDFPQLSSLIELQYALLSENTLELTPLGLSLSDSIGPWLYSKEVNRLSAEYDLH